MQVSVKNVKCRFMTDSQLKLGRTWSGSSSAVTEYIRMANIRNKKSNTACNKIPSYRGCR